MANVVAARWRAKEGCEDRLAPVIAELIPLSCLEPGCPFDQASFAPPAHNYAIPQLLEHRQLEFFTTFYDDRVGLAG